MRFGIVSDIFTLLTEGQITPLDIAFGEDELNDSEVIEVHSVSAYPLLIVTYSFNRIRNE